MKDRHRFLMQLKRLTAALLAVSLFAFSEPISASAAWTNDPYLDAQWGLNNDGKYTYYYMHSGQQNPENSVADVDINLFEGLTGYYPISGKEVIVAVIDTGVYVEHEDLADHVWINTGEIPDNGIDDDGNGYVDDVYGWDFYNNDNTVYHDTVYTDPSGEMGEDDHGTHVAGIIAASANNGIGIAGIASLANVKIMVLKTNGGKNSEGTAESACKAIEYAEKMGADIVNISWGSYSSNEELKNAMRSSKMLFVCAAGNNGINIDKNPMYPAGYDLENIITVTYITPMGKLVSPSGSGFLYAAKGSNYGAKSVDLAAPGVDILSTLKEGYGYKSGSSMAAPYVTGVAALCYAASNRAYATQVKSLIMSTAKQYPSLEGKMVVPGIPDVKAMVSKIGTLRKDTVKPNIKTVQNLEGSKVRVDIIANGFDGSGVYKLKYLEGNAGSSDFQEGKGKDIEGASIVLEKGVYTLYAVDRCENDMISVINVGEDNDPPELSAEVYGRGDYDSFGIWLHVSDKVSTVKKLRYLIGNVADEEVRVRGNEIAVTGDLIKLATEIDTDVITFYAEDGFYNGTYLKVKFEIKHAERVIASASELNLRVGESYRMAAVMFPLDTTDTLRFESTDERIAPVSGDGLVTAERPGECEIIMSTQGGASQKVVVKVH
ncbi:MAG: S8 family serine peptidase [Lachnospiraceae bacterium]|nr:S8 family serine peptidase [Lachnospiraceae bacterium]